MAARPVMTSMLVAVLLFGLFLASCSLVEKAGDVAADNERVTEALIQNRTLAFIDGDPDTADAVQEGAEKLLGIIDGDPDVELNRLRDEVDKLVPWGDLPDDRRRALQGVLLGIEKGVVEYAGDSEALSDRQRVRIRTALGWIVEAAELTR